MKIIIGSESFSPNISGVAVSAELLADNLAKAGHEVYVFAPSRSYKSHMDESQKNFKIYRLRSVINPFREGFRVAFLPKNDVKKMVEEIQPDLIHLQDPTAICSALLKVGKQKNIPIVITNHFTLNYVISYLKYLKPFHPEIRRILKRYLANFYNKANLLLCPTETVKADLIKWGVKVPVEAISNGVDLDRYFSYSLPDSIRVKYHLPMNPLVLYVGRIDKDKSIEVLVRAIPKITEKTNAHFVFAGLGDEIPKMKKLAESLSISRMVSFLGRIEYHSEDQPQLYQIADLFCIPSAIETQSIVTMEAMASGLPVVAADAGALPELVKDGKNGYLFPAGDSDKLADQAIAILENQKLKEKMKRASLEIVSKHEISASFSKVLKSYEKILNDSK